MDNLANLLCELYNELFDFGKSELLCEKLRFLLRAMPGLVLSYEEKYALTHLLLLINQNNSMPHDIANRVNELSAKELRQFRDLEDYGLENNAGAEENRPTVHENKSVQISETIPWSRAEEMFGDNFLATPDGGVMTIEELKKSKLKTVDIPIISPTSSTTSEIYNMRFHSDGRVERIPMYKIQPTPVSGEDELWNDFTQKFLNDIDNESERNT